MKTLQYDDNLGWGWKSPFKAAYRGIKKSVTAPLKAVKYSFTVPYRATKAYVTNRQINSASDLTRFSGDNTVGEEELAHGAEGGCERQALARRASSGLGRFVACGSDASLMSRTLPGIPHEDYRLLVTAAAMRLSNGKPTTKHYAGAKSLVDRSLVNRGIGIVIPSAKPGRVTR